VKSKKRVVTVLTGAPILAALLALPGGLPAQGPPLSPAVKQLVPDNYGDHSAPAQPLPYSHKTHATAGLPCQFCHANPDPGRLMTFPATATCMTCHATIAKNKPAIRQLAAFAKSGKPIPWVRVYSVTPGVTWTHQKHLKAGLKCENCHGQVAQLDAVSETTSVTAMAVCINCHAQNNPETTCHTCHGWPSS
jgi:hypothetical protein